MKHKILQINTSVNVGSTGRIMEDIAQLAMEHGWESYIAYGRGNGGSTSKLIKIGNEWDIKWHGLQTRLFDNHAFASKKPTEKLIERIKEINPDLIHLHNLHGYYLNVEVLFNFLRDFKKPIFWTLYDCWAFTGHCAYFDRANCRKWETGCYNCPLKTAYPSSYGLDNSKYNYAMKKELFTAPENLSIIVNSQWLKNNVKNSFLKEFPVELINNGVNTSIFKPRDAEELRNKLGLKDKFVILGVASVWSERKGLSDFIKLSELLKEDEVIVLDSIDEKLRKKLPHNIIGLERAKSVKELSHLYSMADVYINPTYADNFPTTNLEALACGTPVITYNTGGSPEAVNENTGFVVEKSDVYGLYNRLSLVKDNSKTFFQENCRERAISRFNSSDRYKDIIGLFNDAVERVWVWV